MWEKFDAARKALNNPTHGRAYIPTDDGDIRDYYR